MIKWLKRIFWKSDFDRDLFDYWVGRYMFDVISNSGENTEDLFSELKADMGWYSEVMPHEHDEWAALVCAYSIIKNYREYESIAKGWK